jgi:hypothetical protein
MSWTNAKRAVACVLLPPLFLSTMVTGLLILAVRVLTAATSEGER